MTRAYDISYLDDAMNSLGAMLVAARTGDPLPDKDTFIDIGSPEYWTGWTLAYLSWYLNVDFSTIQSRGLTVQSVYDRYPALHEAPLSKSVQFAVNQFSKTSEGSLLKQTRENARLTQRQLAEITGIPVSVIRSYEQNQRSLKNAETEKVRSICQALGCRIENIQTI